MRSYPPTDDESRMNSEVAYTIDWVFQALPFDNGPDPRFYAPCSQRGAAYRWLSYGIQTWKGMGLLTGGIGCGEGLLNRPLIGQPELRQPVAGIPQLNQQIAVRAQLRPFTTEETGSYIMASVEVAAHRTEVCTREAVGIIYEQRRGIGRLIEAGCDQWLLAGASGQVLQIGDRLVQRVGQVI